jgi:SsrA-binding protein
MKNNKNDTKLIANNKRATFDYEIISKFEAGIALLGSEVKSLRLSKCSINESYIDKTNKNELELVNASISEYKNAYIEQHSERRNRKLLLHKAEINKIINAISKKGLTAIPLKIYFKNGKVKLELAIARGKSNYNKKNSLKEKDIKKEQAKSFKEFNLKL